MINAVKLETSTIPVKKKRGIWALVDLPPVEAEQLMGYMSEELKFYNALASSLASRCRTSPNSLRSLNHGWIRIFSQLAFDGVDVSYLLNSNEDSQLPDNLEPFRMFLVGFNIKGERFLTPEIFSILEVACTPGNLHPIVRRNMALEILRHYQDQSKKVLNRGLEKSVYRSSLEMLPKLSADEKNHLQFPRTTLKRVCWNSDENCTEVWHCYSDTAIQIKNVNLTDKKWNLLVLQPASASKDSSWIIEAKNSERPYLVKYTTPLKDRGVIFK